MRGKDSGYRNDKRTSFRINYGAEPDAPEKTGRTVEAVTVSVKKAHRVSAVIAISAAATILLAGLGVWIGLSINIAAAGLNGDAQPKGNLMYGGHVASQEEWVCIGGMNDLYIMKADGTQRTKLDEKDCSNIIIDGGWVYYLDYDQNICRIRPDGTDRTVIRSNSSHFDTEDGWIYFYHDGCMDKMRVNGAQTATISDAQVKQYVVSGGRIYYISRDGLYSMRTNGADNVMLYQGEPNQVTTEGGFVYFLEDTRLHRIRTDGEEHWVFGITDVMGFNVSGDTIYYCRRLASEKTVYHYEANGADITVSSQTVVEYSYPLYKMDAGNEQGTLLADEAGYWIYTAGDRIYFYRFFWMGEHDINWGMYQIRTDGTGYRKVGS